MESISIVSTAKLKKICNPFEARCWDTIAPVSYGEIQKALDNKTILSTPFSTSTRWSKNKHIKRIAYFVMSPDIDPIEIDLGVPCLGYYPEWPVIDGNHRLAAAIFRNQDVIPAKCSGEVSLIDALLFNPSEKIKIF